MLGFITWLNLISLFWSWEKILDIFVDEKKFSLIIYGVEP